jgi:hypothetical protein
MKNDVTTFEPIRQRQWFVHRKLSGTDQERKEKRSKSFRIGVQKEYSTKLQQLFFDLPFPQFWEYLKLSSVVAAISKERTPLDRENEESEENEGKKGEKKSATNSHGDAFYFSVILTSLIF